MVLRSRRTAFPEFPMTDRHGSCLCGAVRYMVRGEPLVARICWCRTCQKISANGTVNAIFPAEAIEATGTLACYASTADSGNVISRHFCPGCGVHLFGQSSATPQFRLVRVGTLDEPSSIRPQINIWISSAPEWACLDPKLTAVERQPAPVKA